MTFKFNVFDYEKTTGATTCSNIYPTIELDCSLNSKLLFDMIINLSLQEWVKLSEACEIKTSTGVIWHTRYLQGYSEVRIVVHNEVVEFQVLKNENKMGCLNVYVPRVDCIEGFKKAVDIATKWTPL